MLTLEEATSRCWAEVDLGRLRENYKNALSHLTGGARLIAVLKAKAYGLGAAYVARFLRGEGQRFFAAASSRPRDSTCSNSEMSASLEPSAIFALSTS